MRVNKSKILKAITKMAQNSGSDSLFELLKGYEGDKPYLYDDSTGRRISNLANLKGNPTIGVGHKWTSESPGILKNILGITVTDPTKLNLDEVQRRKLYDYDIAKHIPRAKSLVSGLSSYPEPLRNEMISSVFRGGLSGSPKALDYINSGRYHAGAREFLDHGGFRKSVRTGTGVADRMGNLANALLDYGHKQRIAKGELPSSAVSSKPYWSRPVYNPKDNTYKPVIK